MSSSKRIAIVSLLGAAGLLSPQPTGAAIYHVELIGPPAGAPASSFATDLLSGGGVLGYAADGAFDPLAVPFAARGGSYLPLSMPTGSLNFPMGGPKPNLIVGSSSNRPVAWRKGKSKFLRPAGGLGSGFAFDASASGAICGAVYNDLTGAQFPAFWSEGSALGVQLPGAPGLSPEGSAFAINTSGRIAGATGGVFGGFQGARWDQPDREPVLMGSLPGAMNSEALDLNDAGDLVGRSSFPNGDTEAVRFVAATGMLEGLGFLNGNYGVAQGINNLGDIVGTATAGTVNHAFLWQGGVMQDLNDLVGSSTEPFDYLSNAVAIDDAGRIAAEAMVTTATGPVTRIAVLVPAP